jgi:hypothetical protein
VVGRKKIKIHCSKEREIGGGQILFIYLFIIMTWKGSLEGENKRFWGHFYCFLTKKLGIVFGKSVCFPRCKFD